MMINKSNITVSGSQLLKFNGFRMPDHTQKVQAGKDWIIWGLNNLFPNYLNNIFYQSAYQSGIIRGKIHYIVGSGIDGVTPQVDALFGSYSAEDVVELITKDFELYNGFALRVVRSNGGGVALIEHINFDQLRRGQDEDGWFYSDNWAESTQNEDLTGLKFFEDYKPNTSTAESIYVYVDNPKDDNLKKTKDLVNIYPKPIYMGGMMSLLTDIEIHKFHMFNIINGMKISGVLNFPQGEPDNKSEFERIVKDSITPTENSGGILINYANGNDGKAEFTSFSGDDLDKRFLQLEQTVQQTILTAHGVTSGMLFGIKTSGQLGGLTELEASYEIFKKTYVRSRQKTIEENINYLIDGVGVIKLREPEPLFKTETRPEVIEQSFDKDEQGDPVLEALSKVGQSKKKYKINSKKEITEDFDFDVEEVAIREDFGDRHQIGVVIPARNPEPNQKHRRPPNSRLSVQANWTRHYLTHEELANSHLPDKVPTRKIPILKPNYW
jgi:hypothetical protein